MERDLMEFPTPQREIVPYADLKTHQFLNEAIAEGAHLGEPKDPRARISWAKMRNVAGIYFGTSLTFKEIGEMLGLSAKNKRERPRQLVNKFIERLHANCSPQLQERFPLAEIKIGKPMAESVRERISKARGGKRGEILKIVNEGVTRPKEIARRLEVDVRYVDRVLTKLRRRRLVPESDKNRNRRILEKARAARTNQEIEEVFRNVSRSLAYNNRDLFIPVSILAREAGYRLQSSLLKDFLNVLISRGIPFGKKERIIKTGPKAGKRLTYYWVLVQQSENVRRVFEEAEELAKFRRLKNTWQVAGPECALPSTSTLCDRDEYKPFVRNLHRMNIPPDLALQDCPVPIFHSRDLLVVGVGNLTTLMEHAKNLKRLNRTGKRFDETAEHS